MAPRMTQQDKGRARKLRAEGKRLGDIVTRSSEPATPRSDSAQIGFSENRF